MKKICCIFVASFLVISMTIPMVYAGAQPQQTDALTEDASSVPPDRAIGSFFVYEPGSTTFGSTVVSYDYVIKAGSSFYGLGYYDCPDRFLITSKTFSRYVVITNNTGIPIDLTLLSDRSVMIYVDGDAGSSVDISSPYTVTFLYSFSIYLNTGSDYYFEFDSNPQTDYILSPVYQLFARSGVNEEWSSIGVVIFALLPIVTIWLIIGRVFKRKDR